MTLPLRLQVAREVPVDHPAFPGHFPGAPLLPGVSLLAEVLEAASTDATLAERLAQGGTLQQAKFLAPVGPGARLDIALDADEAGLRFEVTQAGVATARGHWTWEAKP